MIDIKKSKVRTWSMLGERGTFGSALFEIAPNFENLLAISADFGRSSGLDRYSKTFPDKFLSVGIAEQNMIGIASGFASEGKIVFATSFASFLTGRSYEQIRIHLGYMKHNVKIVGLAAGVGVTYQGNTHYGLEDIALMRAIPGLTIISPSDSTEVVKATIAAAEFKGPVYLRLVGERNNPIVNHSDYNFEIGKAIKLKEGDDVTIFATGTMVYNSLQAAKLLEAIGISVSVINMHTIKPLDVNAIDEAISTSKLIVTVEEASIVGGLGGAIAEYLSEKGDKPPHLIMGIRDFFPIAGDYLYMLEQCGLLPEQIANDIELRYKSDK
jgi:transketolase